MSFRTSVTAAGRFWASIYSTILVGIAVVAVIILSILNAGRIYAACKTWVIGALFIALGIIDAIPPLGWGNNRARIAAVACGA